MSETLPYSSHDGVLKIGQVELECHVLESGERVFSSRDMLLAFNLQNDQRSQQRVFAQFLARIKFISLSKKDLSNSLSNPIKFKRRGKGGVPTFGYKAELIVEICNAVLELSNKMMLPFELNSSAEASRKLLNVFAKVGVIALVDEATGYQEYRDKDALQKILDSYLKQEHAAWAKRFPDEFYKQMFRLKGWQWRGMSIPRPQVVGRYTKDIVYERLAPGILEELERLNPIDQAGRRSHRHHQHLTDDVGHPALSQHLHAVITLMRISNNWGSFKRNLVKAFPRFGDQLELIEDEAD